MRISTRHAESSSSPRVRYLGCSSVRKVHDGFLQTRSEVLRMPPGLRGVGTRHGEGRVRSVDGVRVDRHCNSIEKVVSIHQALVLDLLRRSWSACQHQLFALRCFVRRRDPDRQPRPRSLSWAETTSRRISSNAQKDPVLRILVAYRVIEVSLRCLLLWVGSGATRSCQE